MINLLALQIRIIATLVLRETRATFGTSQIGYLWAIITPAISVGLLAFIFSLVGRASPYGPSLAVFFATGILTIEFFNKLSNTLMTAFQANKALLTYPLIKETDTLFARAALISATYALIMAIFFGSLSIIGLGAIPAQPGTLLCAFTVIAFMGFSFGTLNAFIDSIWDSWRHIEKVLTRPLIFISGVFYVPSQLPQEAKDMLYYNPVIHLVEWMREGFYPNYNSTILDPQYPIIIGLIMLMVGLAGERFTRKSRSNV